MTYSDRKIEDIEVLERINAMRSQEEKTPMCQNYLNSLVDSSCRKSMVDWCFIVVDSFDLSRETVWIGMSLLDRYLSSGKGRSVETKKSKQKFQLAAITAFFMAVKIHEPVQLGIEMLVKLCRGYYKESNIFATEKDILDSLEWRVCISATTPMEYVRHFLQLLPESSNIANVIEENAMPYVDCATSDVHFSTCKVSAVGVACLAGALDDTYMLSSLERDDLWSTLSKQLEFDIASNEIRKVGRRLLASTSCEPKRQSRASLPVRSSIGQAGEQTSSPISVMQ